MSIVPIPARVLSMDVKARHIKAVEKVRAELFKNRSQAELGFKDNGVSIHMYYRGKEWLGGPRYILTGSQSNTPYLFFIEHAGADDFQITVKLDSQIEKLFSAEVKFSDLEATFLNAWELFRNR